jgi:predicted nucleic acid-binding protein
MSLADRVRGLTRVFLDSAPIIYFVESNRAFISALDPVFERIEVGSLVGVTSPLTLAECLVIPIKRNSPALRRRFEELIVNGRGVEFATIDAAIGMKAAEIRAKYGLRLIDSVHVATALLKQCEALVTNDSQLRRVTEIPILTISDQAGK